MKLHCSFHLRRGEVRGRPTTPSAQVSLDLKLLSTLFVSTTKERGSGATHHQKRSFWSPSLCTCVHRDDSFATPQQNAVRSTRNLPLATCHLQLNRDDRLRNASTKGIGKGATHHPVCVTLRRCPPPYLPLANRDDRLRNDFTYQ
jgi:hypothetical protein